MFPESLSIRHASSYYFPLDGTTIDMRMYSSCPLSINFLYMQKPLIYADIVYILSIVVLAMANICAFIGMRCNKSHPN